MNDLPRQKRHAALLERLREELGEPEAVYRLGVRRRLYFTVSGLLLFVGGIIGLILVINARGFRPHLFIQLLFFLSLIGLSFLITLYRYHDLTALVYPAGLVMLHRRSLLSFPWAAISEVRIIGRKRLQPEEDVAAAVPVRPVLIVPESWWQQEIGILWEPELIVVRDDQTQANFFAIIDDLRRLIIEVQQRTFPHLWRWLEEQWQQDGIVPWGPLKVTAEGIWHHDELLPWAEFGGYSLGRLNLKLLRRPRNRRNEASDDVWLKLQSNELPNLHVMLPWLAHRHALEVAALPPSEPSAAEE